MKKTVLLIFAILIAKMSINAQTFRPQVCPLPKDTSNNYLTKVRELKIDTSYFLYSSKKEYRKLKITSSPIGSYLLGRSSQEDQCEQELLQQKSWQMGMGNFPKLDSSFYKIPESTLPPF
ncbi:MAG TPA: hypothetical protein PKZ56_01950 [Candidatus Paceibacterota bacterium]|nr:hypothetical protein [Candidatus Paceibacterota bacterium]